MNSQALEASPFGNGLKPGFVGYAARRMRGRGPFSGTPMLRGS